MWNEDNNSSSNNKPLPGPRHFLMKHNENSYNRIAIQGASERDPSPPDPKILKNY